MSSYGTDAHCEKVTSNEIHARTRLNTQTVSIGTSASLPDVADPPTQQGGDLWFVGGNTTPEDNGVFVFDNGAWVTIAQRNAA